MSWRRTLRKAAVAAFWRLAVGFTVGKRLIPALFHPWDPMGLDAERGPNYDSLAYAGFSGRLAATVVTLFLKRGEVQRSLPPELELVADERLPDWLRGRDDHPVILLFGRQTRFGQRRRIFGLYQTIPIFRPYLETFVAVPFLKPRASAEPCPSFHFVRVPCSAFWPTELGILQMGWPKVQCPMQMHHEGQTVHYCIADPQSGRPWFTAQTDLAGAEDLAPSDPCLEKLASMLAQPHLLSVGGKIDCYRFDARLETATLKAVSARGTLHPGFLPSISEPIEFAAPKISQRELGALWMETTFLNRVLARSPRSRLFTVRAYLRT